MCLDLFRSEVWKDWFTFPDVGSEALNDWYRGDSDLPSWTQRYLFGCCRHDLRAQIGAISTCTGCWDFDVLVLGFTSGYCLCSCLVLAAAQTAQKICFQFFRWAHKQYTEVAAFLFKISKRSILKSQD
ncbi:hypothetical protein SDJN02_06319, partial [Cucurbita argyrosperma subsp. argyrosperma]